MNIPFFGDIGWFYLSARDALLAGQFPLLGITASMTWLHQGPLWTYMLVPAFWLSNFHPLSPVIFALILTIFLIPSFYFLISEFFNKKTAFLSTLILFLNPWLMMHLRTPYHTSPIPLFEVIFLVVFIKRRDFLAGLFAGLLYQLHLLTFIFWPLLFFRISKKTLLGFFLGILPFIITGPKQIAQLFAWVFRSALAGFPGSNPVSEAYLIVLFIPSMLLLSFIIKKLPKILAILIVVVLLNTEYRTFNIERYAPFYDQFLASAKSGVDIYGQGSKFASAVMPFQYLVWWLDRVK